MIALTIGKTKITKATRLSIWFTNNALGHGLARCLTIAVKPFGVTTYKRYRRPKTGQKYGWGGSLKRQYAENFSLYFSRGRSRRPHGYHEPDALASWNKAINRYEEVYKSWKQQ